MNVIDVTSKFGVICNIDIKFEDENSNEVIKSYTIKEGDIVRLKCIYNSSLIEVYGKIKNISTTSKVIIIDASDKFESNLITINISNIRSIDMGQTPIQTSIDGEILI